ncbi:GtrA family protein [Flavitalea flava]
MGTFTKAQVASLVATLVDFLISLFLFRIVGIWYLAAGVIGTISGGITHFLISRNWVFQAGDKKWHIQASRYLTVWTGNLILNSSVLFLLRNYAGMNFLLAKIVTAVGIAIFYNYILQKRFVFK